MVNEQKLGGTLGELIDRVHALGLRFGLWIEPEMVNEDSDLYRAHPDWAYTLPGRKPAMGRNQLVLDLSRAEVVDYLTESLTRLLRDYPIRSSLKTLCSLLEKHYGQKAILLIDEYDVPLDKAYQHGYYDRMIDVIRAMFGAAQKTNDSLFFAVLTGCLRVSRKSIFTGLNNLTVHSISDSRMQRCARCSMPTIWTIILRKRANGMTDTDSVDRMCTVRGT